MVDIDEFEVDRVMDEVGTDVDVLHARMGLGVVCARNGALVITVQGSGMLLWEAKSVEEGAEPEDLPCAMRTGEVLSLTGRECNDSLLF